MRKLLAKLAALLGLAGGPKPPKFPVLITPTEVIVIGSVGCPILYRSS